MRRALTACVAVLVLTLVLLSPGSTAPASAADPVKARKEAQARANAAAARFSRAETALAKIEAELGALKTRQQENEVRLTGLESQVKALAVNQYMRGRMSLALPFGSDPTQAARGQAMVEFVSLGNTDAVDEYRAAREDLAISAAAVEKAVAERRATAEHLKREKAAAYAELQRLARIEREFLAAQEAARKAAREAAARRAATSRQQASRSAVRVLGTGNWICPVQGPRSFSNDYGAPRSGGRRHQGNDILSPRGTPVVASVSGTVRHHNSSLGGLSYYLRGDDGVTYFGTHLSRYGASGRVSAGTVVGYVGDTGNARGTPHLHFEMHPGGGGPVNPYSTLRAHC